MFMYGAFKLFLSLGLGYALCVVAKKQEGVLKTVGYTLGISILVLTLLYGFVAVETYYGCFIDKMGKICGPISQACPIFKR